MTSHPCDLVTRSRPGGARPLTQRTASAARQCSDHGAVAFGGWVTFPDADLTSHEARQIGAEAADRVPERGLSRRYTPPCTARDFFRLL